MNIVICWRRAASIALLLIATFYPSNAQQTWQMGQTRQTVQAGRTGEITGRVVTEDGNGAPNMSVSLYPVSTGQGALGSVARSVTTDENGNFRFMGLSPRPYQVNIFRTGGYAVQPPPATERRERRVYRIGESATLTLIKGGVITGKVITTDGEPITGVYISALMVRDAEGFKVRQSTGGRTRMTDDRGIYRLYGLAPGTYIVYCRAVGDTQSATTYHPSSTRDTASEVTVSNGSEAMGIDIRLRDERGHVISGTVTGGGDSSTPYMLAGITLFNTATGTFSGSSSARSGESENGFAILGVDDGEYEIMARRGGGNEEQLSSLPRRVTVKGADVTGIELKMAPMASISGRVALEKSQSACADKNKNVIEEILLSPRRDDKEQGIDQSIQFSLSDTGVSDTGDFTVRYLMPGRYRLEPSLPSGNWYVKSITTKSAAPARRTGAVSRLAGDLDVNRSGIAIRAGENLTGITVTVAEGAASLRGKVVAEAEGPQIPSRLRIHLVPAETTAADDVLRYGETLIGGDRTFTFKNLAPGRYWLLTRIVSDEEIIDRQTLPLARDSGERAKLRKEAEAKKNEIELKPCQRVTDHILKF